MRNYGADNVIDNKRKLLRDVLLASLPQAESASFALGYFFISGFNVIIEPIKHLKKLRLLISNTTNQSTAEALIEGFKTVRQAKKELEKDRFVNPKKINQLKLEANKNFSFDGSFRYAVEVRHTSWFNELAYNFFKNNNVSMVMESNG
ncbi:MAG TPA: DUF72 domain-containing protein [Nitrososphaeraceae archaeon]